MKVIRETLWKRWVSTPTKPPAKNSNICLSETAYQHKGTRKKCRKTNQAAIIKWQRQCLMDKPGQTGTNHIARSRKQVTFLSRVPVHCITPFCSDALVSPPNLHPPSLWPFLCEFVGKVLVRAATPAQKPDRKPFVSWLQRRRCQFKLIQTPNSLSCIQCVRSSPSNRAKAAVDRISGPRGIKCSDRWGGSLLHNRF